MSLLPLWDGLVRTSHYDEEVVELVNRHYSRRAGERHQVGGPCRKMVLRNTKGSVAFVWLWPQDGKRWDGQDGFYCSVFRNESARRSSEIILEAEQFAVSKWGAHRKFTYVDPGRVASVNPGYCFKMAGWAFVRVSASGKHLLVKP